MLSLSKLSDYTSMVDRVVCGDAISFMRRVPTGSVDTIITSPPYWQQRDYDCDGQYGLEPTIDAYIDNMFAIFQEARRVLKKQGSLWVNIGDCYNENTGGYFEDEKNDAPHVGKHRLKTEKYQSHLPRRSLLMLPYRLSIKMIDEGGWCCRNMLIWKKKIVQPTSAQNRFTIDFEPLFLFTNGPKYYFHKETVKWIEDGDDVFGSFQRRERRSVWELDSDHRGKTGHKAPYPIDLAKLPIMAACPEGGIVLDMFLGSGTTAIAAKQLGRHFLGCEINPEFCKKAEKRLLEDLG